MARIGAMPTIGGQPRGEIKAREDAQSQSSEKDENRVAFLR
jgi:hypothetical protein